MPRYLLRGRYTTRGLQGAVEEGFVSREAYIRQIAEVTNSTIEAVYWLFGDEHFLIFTEVPNEAVAVARTLATNLTGATEVTMTPVFSSEEMDAAVALMPQYQAPAA